MNHISINSPWGEFYYYQIEKKILDQEFKKVCHSEELEYAKTFQSENRRQEYLTSRYLLRKKYFLNESSPLINHTDGQILWPLGWNGTLSHKNESYAFFATKTNKESFGIDLEKTKVTEKIFNRITTNQEKEICTNLSKPLVWSLVFSMKESLFKSFAPKAGKERFSFIQCELTSINFAQQNFSGFYKHMQGEGFFYLLEEKVICFSRMEI